jgi:hypothetical protein
MKTATYILLLLAVTFLSCENKDLCYTHPHGHPIRVSVHWEENAAVPSRGMRINLFSLNELPSYGMQDLRGEEEFIKLPVGGAYLSLCYDYFGSENIYFRNENHPSQIEAYCASMVRASYTRAYPDENTVAEPGNFYVDRVDEFEVVATEDTLSLDFYPHNALKTYTFRINGIKGAQHITATRGALSGLSGSYFPATGALAATPSTLLFNAAADGVNDCITGTFRTFGRLEGTGNHFTIEILYPSATGDAIARTWEIRDKMVAAENDNSYFIEIDADITIIPEESGSGGGFDATVDEWEEESVPILI